MLRDKALRIHESSPLRTSATFSSGDRQLQRGSTSSDSEGVFGNSSLTCFSMLQDKASSSLQDLASKKSASHQGVHQARQTNSSIVLLAQNLRRLTPSPAMLRDKALRIHESSPLRHSATFRSGDGQLQRRSTSSDSEGVFGNSSPTCFSMVQDKASSSLQDLASKKSTSHQGVHQARQTNSSTVLLAQNLRRLTPSPAMLRDKALRIHESSPLRHSATFSSGDRQLQRRSTSSD